MEAVMLVEVLDDHGHVQQRQRIRGAGGQCRIGRSLACDLTLDDGFAAPEHVLLTLKEDGRAHVRDLGSRNGTRLDGQLIDPEFGRMLAHGELRVGKTLVRVRTAEEQVVPERLFRRDPLRRHRTLLALSGLLLCFAFAAFLQWTFAPEQLAERVLLAELAALAGLAVWVGAWSLVSRLTVGAWQVRIQLAIAAFCVGLWAWGYWLYTLAAFALQWRWIGPFMVVLAGLVALAAAYLHLRKSTHFRRVAALSLALAAPLLCGGVWWLVDLQLDPRTVNRVELGARVYPPALRLAPSVDLTDYLTDVADLKRDANRNRQASLIDAPILDEED
jgi:hypothetical protein